MLAGASAQFTVSASGSGLTYAWQYSSGSTFTSLSNGGRFSGVGTATLQIANTQVSDTGSYRCLVSNSGGQSNSGPASLTVNVPPPPTLTPPQSQTVTLGNTAQFSITVSGQGPFTYSWQYSSGSTFVSLDNGGRISGAGTPTLTITGTLTSDAGSYRCLVGNAGGQSNSGPATLTVNLPPPPTVSAPTNQTVALGNTASFSITASGAGTLTYSWQYSSGSTFVSLNNGGRISGAGTPTLTITGAQTTDAGSYRCLVSNAGGQSNSGPATLTVNLPPPPTVTAPTNQSVILGNTFSFTISASGAGTLTYSWQYSSGSTFVSLNNGGRVSGAGTPTLTVTGAQTADAGSYRCLVSNAGGQSNSGAATLTVNLPPPPTVSAPTNQTVILGNTASFTISASGVGTLTYSWQYSSGSTFVSLNNGGRIAGAGTATLTITGAQASDAGSYRCLVSNTGGQSNSGAATLTVNPPPPPTVSAPTNQTVLLGNTFSFTITASGAGTLTYSWQYSSGSIFVSLNNGGRISGAGTATLTITGAQTSDAGSYRCLVSNAGGQSNSGPATLTVTLPPPPTVGPPANATVPYSTTVTFTVTPTGAQPFTYIWQYSAGANFVPITDAGRTSGSATATLTITSVQPADAGSYRCLVSNAGGTSNSGPGTLTVIVPPPPTVTAPTSQSVLAGATVLFTVSPSGAAPYSFTWQYSPASGSPFVALTDGARISGSATATLQIADTQTSDAGSYRCLVSNIGGQSNSGPASLTVTLPPPPTVSVPATQLAYVGNTVVLSATVSGAGPFVFGGWQFNNGSGFAPLTDGGRVSDSDTAVLTITNAQLADTGTYQLIVGNAGGETTSNPVNLSVAIPTAPTVTQPANVVVPYGGTATFSVTANGEAPLNYVWQFNNSTQFVTLTDGGNISGSATPTLQITNVQAVQVGSYRCLVTNPVGTTNSGSATLTAGQPDFTLSVSPTSRGLIPTGDVIYPVTLGASFGFTAGVTLSLSGLDPNSSYVFSVDPVPGGNGSTNLHIFTTAATPISTQTLTVNATGGGTTHSTTISLVVMPSPTLSLAVSPSQQTLAPGSSAAFMISVNGGGISTPVSLTAAAPSGITTSFDSSTVQQGGTANLTLAVPASLPSGTYTFTVTATAGSATAQIQGSLVVQSATSPMAAPSVSSISPKVIVAGQIVTATITGTNLQGAAVSVPTSQALPSQPVQRVFPGATVASVSPDGTSMQVTLDTTAPGAMDFYNLALSNSVGQDVTQFRVVPVGPIIDFISPGDIEQSGKAIFSLVGLHLSNVSLSFDPPGAISVSNLDTSHDDHTTGLLAVAPGAQIGDVTVTVTDHSGNSFSTTIPITEHTGSVGRPGAKLVASVPYAHGVNNIYFYPPRPRRFEATRMKRPGAWFEDRTVPVIAPRDFGLTFTFEAGFSVFSYYYQTAMLENSITGAVGAQALKQLGLNQVAELSAHILSLYVEVDTSLYWNVDLSGGFTFPTFCISSVYGLEVPGLSGAYEYALCDGSSGSGSTSGSFSNVTIDGGDNTCAQVVEIDQKDGIGFANVTQTACCDQSINIFAGGTIFGGTYFEAPFSFIDAGALSTSPDPQQCQCACSATLSGQVAIAPTSAGANGIASTNGAFNGSVTNTGTATCQFTYDLATADGDLGPDVQVEQTLLLDPGQSTPLSIAVSYPTNQPADVDASHMQLNVYSGPVDGPPPAVATAPLTCQSNLDDSAQLCVVPDGEVSGILGWGEGTNVEAAVFKGAVLPLGVTFEDRSLTEAPGPVPGSTEDTCYFFGSSFQQYTDSTAYGVPGNWTVDASNFYQQDEIGLPNNGGTDVALYYQQKHMTPCHLTTTESMKMLCPWADVPYKLNQFYMFVGDPTGIIRTPYFSICRDYADYLEGNRESCTQTSWEEQ